MSAAGNDIDVAVTLYVNGERRRLWVRPDAVLVDTLREEFDLTGTKLGCGIGVCGACTVLVDGRTVSSCLLLTALVDGAEVETIEGVAPAGDLHPVQEALRSAGGLQCGACTPGQVLAAVNLLREQPDATREEVVAWMSGNLCRCTGYYPMVDAICALTGADGEPDDGAAVASFASRRGVP